jgi:hypothetical protein
VLASASFSQQLFEFMTSSRQIRWSCWLADSHDNIDRAKLTAYLPEYFSNGTPDQRTRYRARRNVFADNDSEPGLAAGWAASAQDDEKLPLPSRTELPGKLSFSAQRWFAGQPKPRRL